MLKGTKFIGTPELGHNVRAYKFSGKNKAVAAVFALYPKEKEKRKLILPSGAHALDIFGNRMKKMAHTASPIPFYLTSLNLNALDAVLKKIKIIKTN